MRGSWWPLACGTAKAYPVVGRASGGVRDSDGAELRTRACGSTAQGLPTNGRGGFRTCDLSRVKGRRAVCRVRKTVFAGVCWRGDSGLALGAEGAGDAVGTLVLRCSCVLCSALVADSLKYGCSPRLGEPRRLLDLDVAMAGLWRRLSWACGQSPSRRAGSSCSPAALDPFGAGLPLARGRP
jgi:hypothetical protein